MRIWTEPLRPRLAAWARKHQRGLHEAQTLLLSSYLAYVLGWWAFGADGVR